ncbi:MAG: restriction endonuclease subunit S [Dehalococcoidia bacterium]|nr:restriction endonuclease subunit S [Dehalococcoidia bacterium]
MTKGTTPTTVGGRFADEGVTFVKVESITSEGSFDDSKFAHIDEATNRLLSRSVLQEGDVLFTIAGTIGRVARVHERILPANTNQAVAIVRPDPAVVDSRFLFYALRDELSTRNARSRVVQSVQANFSLGELSRMTVPLPDRTSQRAIACILGALDDKIELNRKMNATLEGLVRTIFKSWFVDFDPVRAKAEGRDPGLPAEIADLFPSSFVDSELGPIPEGWRVRPLTSTVEVIGGGTPKTAIADFWNGEIPWFSVVDAPLTSDVWVVDTEKKITREGLEHSSARILSVGTTIISARGTVGRVALVGVPMAMNQSCYGLRGSIDSPGFFTYFLTRQMVASLRQQAHGSVFDTITRDTLTRALIVLPPDELIQFFDTRAGHCLNRIRMALLESKTLGTIRDTLLPKLISGELRVGTTGTGSMETRAVSAAERSIFTIGHSNRPIDAFLNQLRRHNITMIADVRSIPFSRHFPHFNREALQASLATAGIKYVFLGDELGARPKDPACYNEDGSVDYQRLAARPQFRRGIVRVLAAANTERVALMCSEREPLNCHRTLLIGRVIAQDNVAVQHILPDDRLECHSDTEKRLMAEEQRGASLFDLSISEGLGVAQAYSQRILKVTHPKNERTQ